MALTKIRVGTNEDGSPHFLYQQDDPSKPVVLTGPISGSVTLPDGTVYDVTDTFIEVEPGHHLLVSDAIGARHEAEGHPDLPGEQFVPIPSSISHNLDGTPSEAHAEAIHDTSFPSTPSAILNALTAEA